MRPDLPSPHDQERGMSNERDKEREAKRNAIRDELMKWMQAPHPNPTHETEFHGEELERWVDIIFAIDPENGSVTVRNIVAFEPLMRVQKGLPPYVTEIHGNVATHRMGITSLAILRNIAIRGDLSLSGITDKTVPDNLIVDGSFIVTDRVPPEVIEGVKEKYGEDKIKNIRSRER